MDENLRHELRMLKCCCCGIDKVCLNFQQYAYKYKRKYCCSYHCMREMQKNDKTPKKNSIK